MSSIKDTYVGVKGLFKKKTPAQKVRNNSFLQQIFGKRFFLNPNFLNVKFTAYLPDSVFIFEAHPEFKVLFKKFTFKNKINNGGDTARLLSIILNIKQVMAEGIKGEFAELGVWRGNTAAILAHYANKHQRKVYLFDTFEGFNNADFVGIDAKQRISFDNTSIDLVKKNIGSDDVVCSYIKGFFPKSITEEHENLTYAIVSLDCDLYAPTKAGLLFFYDRMPKGGIFFLHDYSSLFWEGSKLAIDEFCKEKNEYVILMPDKSGSAFLRKSK